MSQKGGLCHHSQQHQVVEQEGGGWRRGTQASLHLGLPAPAPSPAGQTELKLHCRWAGLGRGITQVSITRMCDSRQDKRGQRLPRRRGREMARERLEGGSR